MLKQALAAALAIGLAASSVYAPSTPADSACGDEKKTETPKPKPQPKPSVDGLACGDEKKTETPKPKPQPKPSVWMVG